jgi:hypothetical protein
MNKVISVLALTSMLVSAAPMSVALADDSETGIGATFSVTAFVTPNTDNVTYCGGTPLNTAAEAHGSGFSAVLGPLTLFLQKTIQAPSGPMHGCLTLTSPNGSDALFSIYDGTEGPPNASGFTTDAHGTLTVTRAKGRFAGLKGQTLQFKAIFYGRLFNENTVSAYYSVN